MDGLRLGGGAARVNDLYAVVVFYEKLFLD